MNNGGLINMVIDHEQMVVHGSFWYLPASGVQSEGRANEQRWMSAISQRRLFPCVCVWIDECMNCLHKDEQKWGVP